MSFSVLFNGEKLEEFNPSRSIRQGDPISSYLFLLAAGSIVPVESPEVNHHAYKD